MIAAILDSLPLESPFSIDSITPLSSWKINQFPFEATTFFTMDHKAFVDSFYLFIDHYRNGALLESLVKNIPHSGAAVSGTVNINLPDRQVGDIIKLRAEATDSCMLHHQAVYPDTGWVIITIIDSITSAESLSEDIDYSLDQNHPNPFNPSTTISYSIPVPGRVRLTIYDALGREVRKLVDDEKASGKYEIEFNADDLASGIYVYRLTAGERVLTKKMILLK